MTHVEFPGLGLAFDVNPVPSPSEALNSDGTAF